MNNVLRMPKLHRNPAAMGKILRNIERNGWFLYNSKRVKLDEANTKVDGVYVYLAYTPA
ncbi:hypothetical protein NVP2095A_70 [Vibrio phage 2.095.A._10N.286.46.E10]|nr:hypothetical protein NVP2095A_70 [Vibrio phage 2.095.A._10N.286.46.E10]AUS02228.1 hypothetical protein NVP2095B_70 [Vibrio phage 2.095.B._10N.286.46.E10]